jgi:hypothetical protein
LIRTINVTQTATHGGSSTLTMIDVKGDKVSTVWGVDTSAKMKPASSNFTLNADCEGEYVNNVTVNSTTNWEAIGVEGCTFTGFSDTVCKKVDTSNTMWIVIVFILLILIAIAAKKMKGRRSASRQQQRMCQNPQTGQMFPC